MSDCGKTTHGIVLTIMKATLTLIKFAKKDQKKYDANMFIYGSWQQALFDLARCFKKRNCDVILAISITLLFSTCKFKMC